MFKYLKLNLVIILVSLFSISCSVVPTTTPDPVIPTTPPTVDYTTSFTSNIVGNYTTVDSVVEINSIHYSILSNQGIRLNSSNITISFDGDADNTNVTTTLEFIFKKASSTNAATYLYNTNTSISIKIDENKNLLINDVIVAHYVNDQTASTFASNVQGGYVSTAGTETTYSLGFGLHRYMYSLIDNQLKITLTKQDGTPVSLVFVQAINESNAIFLLEGTTRTAQNEIFVSIAMNGDIMINGTRILRKIQPNAEEYKFQHRKYFITKNAAVNLGGKNINFVKNDIMYFDVDNNLILRTDSVNFILKFDRAIHVNEAIFDYEYDGNTDKESITIEDGYKLMLEGQIIAQAPNLALENNFKQNMYHSSYATVKVDNFTVDYWNLPALTLLEGNIFNIDENNLNLKLQIDSGEIVWEYAFAYTETDAVYSYNGKYIIVSIDANNRQIKAVVGANETIIAEDASTYFETVFETGFKSTELMITKPFFTVDNVEYTLPILSFTPTNTSISITDLDNNVLTMNFVNAIDQNSAKYNIVTKTGTIKDVTVTYTNQELFFNTEKIAVPSTSLTKFEKNYLGRYIYKSEVANTNTYGFISSNKGLTLNIYVQNQYTIVLTVKSMDGGNPNTSATFYYNIYYQNNPVTLSDVPPNIREKMLFILEKAAPTTLKLVYNETKNIIYIRDESSPFLTKIQVKS